MKRIFGAMLLSLLLTVASAEGNLQALLQEAQDELGPFHTWTFQQKADFYNKHVYHHEGTRRGVPGEAALSREEAILRANEALCTYLSCGEEGLADWVTDVDFWIEAYPDQDREHEFYDVHYLAQENGRLTSRYQVILSPYSGEIIDLYDLEKLRQE